MGFITWHRRQVDVWQKRLGLDSYQLLWIVFFKGLLFGILLTLWLS